MDNWILEVKCYALQCLCAIGMIIGVIAYKTSVMAALHLHKRPVIQNNAAVIVAITAACVNLVAIFCLEFVSDTLTVYDLCPGTLLLCLADLHSRLALSTPRVVPEVEFQELDPCILLCCCSCRAANSPCIRRSFRNFRPILHVDKFLT